MQLEENGFDTPAPPSAGLVRDFVNSYEPQEDAESLGTATALRDWFATRGLVPAEARMTADDVAAAHRIREGLRAVLLGHAGHADDADPAARSGLDAELARLPLRASFDADGDLRLTTAGSDFERGIAGVLDAIRASTAAGEWERLKVCARDTCRWAFYDASRNHARRWCSMAGCGNYIKMRRRAGERARA
ncbi:CGNR zinc finger domain-containing protein [Promicromonospora sukumoe]|uniref:CGNR zinc finger domain-containing protein n=1 Tax=Promicromonospora sukumoe TaxID=88382 RepID=UPI0003737596|nr:CGNR zinc finger domain-containing protein [Promicromonospora sukumoe]